MNYPFLHQTLDILNAQEIKKSVVYTGEKITVWDDWQLLEVDSAFIRDYLNEKFSHLNIFKNFLFISEGTQSNFHLDRFYAYHLLHRVLIPLQSNFRYEWIVNEKVISYSPKAGEVLLFNNMVPHRFVANKNEKREVIYVDLYDPLVEKFLLELKGNYSQENAELEKKYKTL